MVPVDRPEVPRIIRPLIPDSYTVLLEIGGVRVPLKNCLLYTSDAADE